jgi:3-isopropylmalate dehydratase
MESVSTDVVMPHERITDMVYSNDFGIRCIIAPSFAEIFKTNTMQNGMLPIALSPEDCKILYDDAMAQKELEVDLEKQEVRRETGEAIKFTVDGFRRHCLLNGLDDIGLTLQKSDAISAFEQRRSESWPWLDGFGYVKGGKIAATGPAKSGAKMDW